MTKDELYAEAKRHGIVLNRRLTIEQMTAAFETARNPGPATDAAPTESARPALLRNKVTGVIWPWNKAYAGNPDLEPYYEDS